MVQVLTFSIDDPSWSLINVSQKTIQAYGKKYMILKVGETQSFVVFDMVGPDDEEDNGPFYIPSSFPFMLPLYRSPSLYVAKAKVSARVPTGWISDKKLAWKNMRLVSVAEDDIQSIQAQWQGLSIREAMQRVLEHDWKKTVLERKEDDLIGINIVETLDDELEKKEGFGDEEEAGGREETIDDWLEEELDNEVDGEGDDLDDDGDEDEEEPEEGDEDGGIGDIDAEMAIEDGAGSEDGFEDED